MEEKKLTDEEILQGLECCRKGCRDKSCFGVEMDGIATCTNILTQNALDLIHRLQSEKAEYEQKLDDGELVSKDWHDEQVLHLQEENDRLNDMKFTQEHCDLYKENEWLKAELKRELAEHEEFTQKAKADIESLKCNSYKTSWKAKFLEAKAEVERLTEENAILKENPPILVGRSLGKTIRAKLLAFDKMKEQNAELQKQISILKDIKLATMEEKLTKALEMLISLQESVIENRAISYAVGDTICGREMFKRFIEKAKEEISSGK